MQRTNQRNLAVGPVAKQRVHWILKRGKRRRKSTVIPEVPLIFYGDFEWDETEEGWADGLPGWYFLHGILPIATFEIWVAKASNGFQYSLVDTIPSSFPTSDQDEGYWYRHCQATDVPDTLRYKIRYRNGADLRPFSNERDIIVTL